MDQKPSPASPESAQRRWARHPVDVRVTIRSRDNTGVTTTCHGQGSDVSIGGMALQIPLELQVKRKIKLILTLPGSERQIECEAIVRNRDGFHYGLEFLPMPRLDEEALRRACQALSGDGPDEPSPDKPSSDKPNPE